MNLRSEKSSLENLRLGKLDGLRWIYDNYSEKLLNVGYRVLLSREQARDMVQDLFVRLPEVIVDFRGESGLGTWLFRVAYNMCLKQLQQSKNRNRLEMENIEMLSPKSLDVDYPENDFLAKALAILDAESRSILWLKDGEGVSLEELSQIFKMPEGTVKSRLSRAREKIREFVKSEAEFEKL